MNRTVNFTIILTLIIGMHLIHTSVQASPPAPGFELSSIKKIRGEDISGAAWKSDPNGLFGHSIAFIGDFFGSDGIGDLAVGEPLAGGNVRPAMGQVYVLDLATLSLTPDSDDNPSNYNVDAIDYYPNWGDYGKPYNNNRFGAGVTALGDVDENGMGDFAVLAPGYETLWRLRGNHVPPYVGPSSGDPIDVPPIDPNCFPGYDLQMLELNGEPVLRSGNRIYAVGNTSGNQVIVGGGFGGGETYINVSSFGGVGEGFGRAIACVGDLNGDGNVDLAVGEYRDNGNGSHRGAVWILELDYGFNVTGYYKIGDGTGGLGSLPDGTSLGRALAPLGDLDNNGIVDLAVMDNYSIRLWYLHRHEGDIEVLSEHIIDPYDPDVMAAEIEKFEGGLACLGDWDGAGGDDLMLAAGILPEDDPNNRSGIALLGMNLVDVPAMACTAECMTPVVSPGGQVQFHLSVENLTDEFQAVKVVSNIYLCHNVFFKEDLYYGYVPFDPYQVREADRYLSVPASIPPVVKFCDLKYELVVLDRASGEVLCASTCTFQIQD
jgi:hypothetical protein